MTQIRPGAVAAAVWWNGWCGAWARKRRALALPPHRCRSWRNARPCTRQH